MIREEGIHHVYISGFPFSSFLIGPRLKRLNDVRVAIDYREPWTQSITYPLRTVLGFQVNHLDVEFYDRFYQPGSVTEAQRQHTEHSPVE